MSTPSSFQKLMTKARNIVPFLHPLPISPRFAEEQGSVAPLQSTPCRGVDLSCRVVAVGRKVVDISPGEGVFGRLSPVKPGSLAEYVIAPYEGIVVLPVSISPWLAGAAGTSPLVANQSIAPDFQAADKVFINGGSGGVESFAIQVAKALDCHVTVTCSTDKIGLCQSLGADEVIDYKKVDVMNALY
ncbi:hypothetical protein VD0003_g10076 [Verticillium dahliae]|nr:hypothetical protein VD0003_g10076 [Verticillium dahliae]